MAGTRNRWGSGSIRERPGRAGWELRVSAGRDPVTKRYRYVSRSFTGTEKEAEAALAALLTEVNSGSEIAAAEGATVAAVQRARSRALRKLRIAMSDAELSIGPMRVG